MLTRRSFVANAAAAAACATVSPRCGFGMQLGPESLWREFPPGAVFLDEGLEQQQRRQTCATLAQLEDDSLLAPFRKLGGAPAPGPSLGGWYGADGWAPGHCLGQWMSAIAREAASSPQSAAAQRERLTKLIDGLTTLGPKLAVSFRNNAFPSYTYDKLLLGMMDAHAIGVPNALPGMAFLTEAAEPSLPPHALDRSEMCLKPPGPHDTPSCLDENYTLPENQYLAWKVTGDPRYRERARRFLLDGPFFDRLARGENALIRQHAYSHMNALSSGLAAYLNGDGDKYRRAVTNGFRFVQEQSYPTGGWGPEEEFIDPATDRLYEDLKQTHRGFETPCGSYAHFKLARTLLGLTRNSMYGDSMERVLYNTVLGALPLETDGRAFYYSDYNLDAEKGYFPDRWPCCGGTLPMVAQDYRRNIYFQSRDGVVVNLYQPSSVRLPVSRNTNARLTQTSDYPASGDISLKINLSKPARFSISLRIPAWASGAEIRLPGEKLHPAPGTFARIQREWRDGDRIELTLPMNVRLEPLGSSHPEFVAAVRGPLVLFGPANPTPLPRAELIAAAQRSFVPFTGILPGRPYSLFQRLA